MLKECNENWKKKKEYNLENYFNKKFKQGRVRK